MRPPALTGSAVRPVGSSGTTGHDQVRPSGTTGYDPRVRPGTTGYDPRVRPGTILGYDRVRPYALDYLQPDRMRNLACGSVNYNVDVLRLSFATKCSFSHTAMAYTHSSIKMFLTRHRKNTNVTIVTFRCCATHNICIYESCTYVSSLQWPCKARLCMHDNEHKCMQMLA